MRISTRKWWHTYLSLAALLTLALQPGAAEERIDQFGDLDEWREVAFREISKGSDYASVEQGDLLRVRSQAGASMLVLQREVDVYATPILTWRWMVTEELPGQNLKTKEGDDAPIRLYIAFRRPLSERGFGERLWARLQENLYGATPPDSALNFVWSSTQLPSEPFLSAYTDRQYVILPRPRGGGSFETGRWLEHRVNVLETYRELFGADPPSEAFLAVMGDSDNTGDSSEAYLDYLHLLKD